MQFEGFFQISEGLFFGFALTGDVHFETL